MTSEEHADILARLLRLEQRTKLLSDSDLSQHENIREALELVRALSGAVELLLRNQYRATTPAEGTATP